MTAGVGHNEVGGEGGEREPCAHHEADEHRHEDEIDDEHGDPTGQYRSTIELRLRCTTALRTDNPVGFVGMQENAHETDLIGLVDLRRIMVWPDIAGQRT